MSRTNDALPLVVTEAQLRAVVRLDMGLVDLIESAFAALAEGRAVMPPVLSLHLPAANGEVDVKTAAVEGWGVFAVKISTGFFDNPARGLPSLMGAVVVLDARTGQTRAVLMDNGYLTDLRTAAAGAVAARHLATREIRTVGIIGCGVQGGLQLEALRLVRKFERALVWGRDRGKAARYAERMADTVKIPVSVAETPEEVVRQSEIVVTTTAARAPLIRREWLHPGLHITAMGSDADYKQELDAATLHAADLVVCDRLAQSERIGEIHHACADAPPGWRERIVELGAVVTGRAASRSHPAQITVCDLTGTGVQDTAIARHALQLIDAAVPRSGTP